MAHILNSQFKDVTQAEAMSAEVHYADWEFVALCAISDALENKDNDVSAVAGAMYAFALDYAESNERTYEFKEFLTAILNKFGKEDTLEIFEHLLIVTSKNTPLYAALGNWCQEPARKVASPTPTPL